MIAAENPYNIRNHGDGWIVLCEKINPDGSMGTPVATHYFRDEFKARERVRKDHFNTRKVASHNVRFI